MEYIEIRKKDELFILIPAFLRWKAQCFLRKHYGENIRIVNLYNDLNTDKICSKCERNYSALYSAFRIDEEIKKIIAIDNFQTYSELYYKKYLKEKRRLLVILEEREEI